MNPNTNETGIVVIPGGQIEVCFYLDTGRGNVWMQ